MRFPLSAKADSPHLINFYGSVGYGGNIHRVHRLVYTWFRGVIPDGMHLHHTCSNSACANPLHLDPVTPSEHAKRGYLRRDRCRRGHPSEEWKPKGSYKCRTCYENDLKRRIRRKRGEEVSVKPPAAPKVGWERKRLEDRFWEKVSIGAAEECWEWQSARARATGYGYFSIGGKQVLAHRAVWTLANGDIPTNMLVCHRCDNPGCVNPDHLFLGTSADNVHDCFRKGRRLVGDQHPARTKPETLARGDANGSRKYPERLTRGQDHWTAKRPFDVPRGVRMSQSKLTEAQVLEIRARHAQGGVTNAAMAREYGVSKVLIGLIVRRLSWTHLP
jgi:hypothetical protein